MRKHLLAASLAALALILPTAAVATPRETLLTDKQQQTLGKGIAALFEAKQEQEDINESYEDLKKAVDKLQKTNKKKLRDGQFLTAVEDWERALYYSNAYKDSKIRKGRMDEKKFDGFFGSVEYAIHTPKGYNSRKGGPYPLLIAIPEKGEKGKEHLIEHWVENQGRTSTILVACNMPSNARMWSQIGSEDNPGGADTVLQVLREVKQSHAVDVNRVFLAGFDEGVAAVVQIVALYPHVFAGVIGRAGDIGDLPPTNLRNTPSIFAGGGERCAAFAAKAKEDGFDNVTVDTTATEADIWAWMADKGRDANPTEVSFTPLDVRARQAYWLNVGGFDVESSPKIHAKIDKETNTISVDADGISTVTIYFNDLLVDLSQPVRLICNGTEHEDFFKRRLKTLLDIAFNSADYGRIYVNFHTYDIPAKSE